jgi:hypothetical protein
MSVQTSGYKVLSGLLHTGVMNMWTLIHHLLHVQKSKVTPLVLPFTQLKSKSDTPTARVLYCLRQFHILPRCPDWTPEMLNAKRKSRIPHAAVARVLKKSKEESRDLQTPNRITGFGTTQ